jgi:glutathione-regulated potassium-efflux system ancillary protein KefG
MDKFADILILFAHPALQNSRVHIKAAEAVQSLDGVTFHDLYESYPDFSIDYKEEQSLLLKHDIYIFQFPMYWYSTPAILKEWQDLVLEHNWAYGPRGTVLKGKKFMCALSAGGAERVYRESESGRFSLRRLLTPLEKMAGQCGMEFLPPFVIYNTFAITADEILWHAERYRRLITAMRFNKIHYPKLKKLTSMNRDLDDIIEE